VFCQYIFPDSLLGGILAASGALSKLITGLSSLMGAAITWQQVALFCQAGARSEARGTPPLALALSPHSRATEHGQPVLEARDLIFCYDRRGEPTLRACSLQVYAGDRRLLAGPSGPGLWRGLRSVHTRLVVTLPRVSRHPARRF
jgi:ABC-type bacteriocin/lantibiotic exporter with double-glycine peptidase domain